MPDITSFRRYFGNILSWYGIYWEEARLYSTIYSICGGKLHLKEKTKHMRIMECNNCGFKEDRDNIPLYWALKKTSLKDEASPLFVRGDDGYYVAL